MARDNLQSGEPHGTAPTVGRLAMRVVSVLNNRQGLQGAAIRPYIASILDRRVIARGPFSPPQVLDELLAFRLDGAAIVDLYIPAAARKIGDKWVDNELGFAEVTIASSRLQALLAEIAYREDPGATFSYDPPSVMMVSCQGDQHTLGAFVAAAQMRRRGAIVEVVCAEPVEAVKKRAITGGYDVVVFSCSRRPLLESVGQLVTEIRDQAPTVPAFALGGIVVGQSGDAQRSTGVDLVTNDIDEVMAYCEPRSTSAPNLAAK